MNEEDDEVEGSRRSLPTKQIKISIQLSFHDILWLFYIQLMFEYFAFILLIAHSW